MFQQFTNYLLGSLLSEEPSSSVATEGVDTSRLTSEEADEEWVLLDRDSEGNSDLDSLESLDGDDADDDVLVVEESPNRVIVVRNLSAPALLTRTNSASSLPNSSAAMEESWFLTPPPCFISSGPVHMETSPLENLLIEHPSMSVYTHHGRRNNLLAAHRMPSPEPEEDVEEETQIAVINRAPRVNRVHVLQQNEIQGLKSKRAQKMQTRKSCKTFTRGCLNRNNKAREVNSRNRRQRRGERSQGSVRSCANNNRKC